MGPLELSKKKNLIKDKNDYYVAKFNKLMLEIRCENFDKATRDLKDNYNIIGTHHSNILVKNHSTNELSFIKKEHFEDYLDDEEKEGSYKKIKKYIYVISRAERILKEWEECLLDINENFYRGIIIPPNDSLFDFLYNYRFDLHRFSLNAPSPIQPNSLPTLNINFEGDHPPADVVEFLYKLCDGDISQLETLAKFSYNLIYNPKNCLATVILANENIHESLRKYFDLLSYTHVMDWSNEIGIIDFKKMRLKENHMFLLEHELNNDLPIILINGSTIYKKGEVHSFFKKLFAGKKLKIDSPYFDDELIIKNRIPMVCLIKDEKKYRALKNLYEIKGIEISPKELNVPEKSSKSADWLRNEFLCIGQKQVKINPYMSIPYEVNHEKIVQRFLRICCTFGEGKDCTKRALHEAYVKYFEHCYPDEKALTQRTLSGIVKKLKCERLEVRRIHDGRDKPNLQHFIGMELKENHSELYKDEPIHNREKTEIGKFEIILNKLVDETFKDVKLNKRRVAETIDVKH